jgi:hypothetical protein
MKGGILRDGFNSLRRYACRHTNVPLRAAKSRAADREAQVHNQEAAQSAERGPLLEQLEQEGQKTAPQTSAFLDLTKYAEDRAACCFIIAVIIVGGGAGTWSTVTSGSFSPETMREQQAPRPTHII